MRFSILFCMAIGLFCFSVAAQNSDWQQQVEYEMEIDMDAAANQFSGEQSLKYYNNSPDTLDKVYFHLYFNAFQPGSMMDVRSRAIDDPDRRVNDRIYYLKEDEIGYHQIDKLSQDGKKLKYSIEGTVMTVELNKPLLPKTNTTFQMTFDSKVPLQVRRSGRDSKEGIRFSMTQWYPKIAQYDIRGWHAHQYVGREFYGPFGDFDVKITIDSAYTVAAGGVLQNPDQIGKGYSDAKTQSEKLTYHFVAENVLDFMWAADPDYQHDVVEMTDGLEFHYFYQPDTLVENWKELQELMSKALPFIEENFGKYPYPVYNFIQGGDGGMEYPMGTLITGLRKRESLIGVSIHELMHSWYPLVVGVNETYLYWIDEGFATYSTNVIEDFLFNPDNPALNPQSRPFAGYSRHAKSGNEEPLTTHADQFTTNYAYRLAAYYKGAIALRQLKGIVGEDDFRKGMVRFFKEWQFKHPSGIDFMRVMERQSGLELDWFFDYWIGTTKTIDYGIRSVYSVNGGTQVQLEKIGEMPMPIDVKVTLNNGDVQMFRIANSMLLGNKTLPKETTVLSNWPWVNPYYSFQIEYNLEDIKAIEIDPDQYIADIDRSNNNYPLKSSTLEVQGKAK